MKTPINQTFLQGLSLFLPFAIALYFIIWLVGDTEQLVKKLLITFIPESYYIPGLGLVALVVVIFLLGLLMYPWLAGQVVKAFDKLMRKIPIFSSIYSPMRDLMDMFGNDISKQLGQPVMITVPNTKMETLGFITREDAQDLPDGLLPENHVVVYVQWSSQVGGYCFIVPKDHIRKVNLTAEEGMRWALTAGLSAPPRDQKSQVESSNVEASNNDG